MSEELIEKLRNILLAEDFAACVEFFQNMPEEERRSFVKPIVEMAREFRRKAGNASNLKHQEKFEAAANASDTAIIATGTLGAVKRVANRSSFWLSGRAQSAGYRILENRQPAWLSQWCDYLLERDHFLWGLVRRLEQAGLCQPQKTNRYVLGMADCLVGQDHARLTGLRDNPELLESLVWRLFEIEGFWEDRAWENKRFRTEENSWAYALRELSKSGKLDRGRLLDASLDALKLDFRDVQAGWYRFFHEYLQPSFDERAARAERYLELAVGPHLPTASFAMKALLLIHKGDGLDVPDFVSRIEPALFAKTKAVVQPVLKILSDIADSEPSHRADITRTAAIGLEHKMPDLQEAAFSLVEAYGNASDEELSELIRERLGLIPTSLIQRVTSWLGLETGTNIVDPPSNPNEEDALLKRANALPEELAHRTGVESVLKELQELKGFIPAIELPVPWLRTPDLTLSALMTASLYKLRYFFGEPARTYIDDILFELVIEALQKPKALMEKKGALHKFVWSTTPLPRFTPDIREYGPDDPVCPLTRGMLCYYIGGDEGTAFLNTAIQDGRISGKEIGLTFRRLLFVGEVRPNHKATQLTLVAESSPLHRQAVRWMLMYGLGEPAARKLPHNVHLLMELLLDLSIEKGEAVTDAACRAFLEGIGGTGKAAKLAKKLLALEEGAPLPHRRAAAVAALRGRLERAERWMGADGAIIR